MLEGLTEEMFKNMYKGISGNKKAQQRARVYTIKVRDLLKAYREFTTRKD